MRCRSENNPLYLHNRKILGWVELFFTVGWITFNIWNKLFWYPHTSIVSIVIISIPHSSLCLFLDFYHLCLCLCAWESPPCWRLLLGLSAVRQDGGRPPPQPRPHTLRERLPLTSNLPPTQGSNIIFIKLKYLFHYYRVTIWIGYDI